MTHAAHDTRRALAAIGIALLSALFFTMTYVLNRASANDGGHWAWTAALRYLLTLPLLLPLMPWQGGIAPVWRAMRSHPGFADFPQPTKWARTDFVRRGLPPEGGGAPKSADLWLRIRCRTRRAPLGAPHAVI